ncbi:Similar to hypothetical protein [Tuber melanosporum Mel28]; acc. no. XP_002837230 [Pyronema omphalodes CBS 100304]|uniref:Wings apart-like protein C-terminal domain-containing protein n=1 Tax=Pyronema omphalodes (strain CBS 100304) TaxID=1076935 RepID=U4L9L0_PYROM|nr:Similar to hypothetical protein [Tuber melanosporum Mel28]; acc. no. XP_002837230 [Pyronema omphalodes CBS 100304]
MDTPTTRRRPVVTYGRQSRRAPRALNLELDEIFSPVASPKNSPGLPSVHLKPALSPKSTNPTKSAYNKPVVIPRKPTSPDDSESGSSTREEDQVTAQLDRETRLHPTTNKELDLFDVPSSDDEAAPPPHTRTSAVTTKPRSTATATVSRELDLFDVPYSDDEAPAPPTKTITKLPAPTAHTLKRKRVANKPTKNEKIAKAISARNEIPLQLPPIGPTDAIMPKAKKAKTKEDTTGEKKITEGGRITKPVTKESGKDNNAAEKAAAKLTAKLQRGMNAIEPTAISAPPPARSRVTRSVSRALSEEPPATIFEAPVERSQATTKKRELDGNTVKKTVEATNGISGVSSAQPVPKQSPRKAKMQKPPPPIMNSPPPKKPVSLGVIMEESPAPQKLAHGTIVLNSKPPQLKTVKEVPKAVTTKQVPTKVAAPEKPVQAKTMPPKPIAAAKTGEAKNLPPKLPSKDAPVRQTTKTTTTTTTTTTKKVVSKIRTVSKPEVGEKEIEQKKDTPMEETAPSYSQQLSLFAYDESSPEPIARPRKRLIDVLGGGQDGPRKNSCSPFFSDGDPEGLEDGAVSLNQETSLNEATILSLQRSTTGGRGPRITYARERSYRMNDATSLEDMLNIPMDTPLTPHEPARKKIEEHIQPMEVEEEKPRTQIKNIHELRAAGEYNRFVDDVEDLFLDIEGGATIGQKRNG